MWIGLQKSLTLRGHECWALRVCVRCVSKTAVSKRGGVVCNTSGLCRSESFAKRHAVMMCWR
jgi:hypothetical protein